MRNYRQQQMSSTVVKRALWRPRSRRRRWQLVLLVHATFVPSALSLVHFEGLATPPPLGRFVAG